MRITVPMASAKAKKTEAPTRARFLGLLFMIFFAVQAQLPYHVSCFRGEQKGLPVQEGRVKKVLVVAGGWDYLACVR